MSTERSRAALEAEILRLKKLIEDLIERLRDAGGTLPDSVGNNGEMI